MSTATNVGCIDIQWTNGEVKNFPLTVESMKTLFTAYMMLGVTPNDSIVYSEYEKFVLKFFDQEYAANPDKFAKKKPSLNLGNSYYKETYTQAKVDARTQKARGIQFIANNSAGLDTLPFAILLGDDADTDKTVTEKFMEAHGPSVFARPCPQTPRHGFVDSRRVSAVDEALALFRTVKDVDPNGELVLMPEISANYNTVVTPTSITVGKGHDGATTGVQTRTFPLLGSWMSQFGNHDQAGIAEGNVPYLETVTADNQHYLVQMRGGPSMTTRALDYVPTSVEVTKVIEATGDLLEWETLMQTHAGQSGVVVNHVGGSLTSHYGVHAMLNNLPVMTTRAAHVGEVLDAVGETVTPDYLAVIAGIVDALRTPYGKDSTTKRVTSMIYATQYWSVLGGTDAYYIGYALGTMLSFGMAACAGEYRHGPAHTGEKISRNATFTEGTKDFLKMRLNVAEYAACFACDYWPGGYGGPKWFDCAKAVIELDKVVRIFMRDPNAETFKVMMMAQNKAINQAHNGGWWFNKFIGHDVFEGINHERLSYILNAAVYMYEFAPKPFNQEAVLFYNSYVQSKRIRPAIALDTRVRVETAQMRLVMDNPTAATPDQIKDIQPVRIQIAYANGQKTEQDKTFTKQEILNMWSFRHKDFKKSLVSSIVSYVPLTFGMNADKTSWEFSLKNTRVWTAPVETRMVRVGKKKSKKA